MRHKSTQRLTVRLPHQIHHHTLKMLTQGAEQHVQLGCAGVLERHIVVGVGEDAQLTGVNGERAVDQRRVEPAQVPQGIAEIERRFEAQHRQAVAARHAEVQQQGALSFLLCDQRQMRRHQRAVTVALGTVNH
nr:hypothetical protein [Tanacetum cinerariifolium]